MAFGVTKDSVSLNDIKSRVTEIDILSFYLNIKELPCVINSPFREDNRPSFGIYLSNKSQRVYYKDYATNDSGGLFDLLGKLWNCNYKKVLENINKDINNIDKGYKLSDKTFSDNDDLTGLIFNIRYYLEHKDVEPEPEIVNHYDNYNTGERKRYYDAPKIDVDEALHLVQLVLSTVYNYQGEYKFTAQDLELLS